MFGLPDYLIEEDKIIEIATSPLEYSIIHKPIDTNAKINRFSINLL